MTKQDVVKSCTSCIVLYPIILEASDISPVWVSRNLQMQSILHESLHVNEDIVTEALAGNVCQTHKDQTYI